MGSRRFAVAVALVVGPASVVGCSSGSDIPALERGSTDADRWPGDESQLEGYDAETVRLLVSHENANYFVVTSADKQTACLFKFPVDGGPGDGVGGCGAAGGADTIVEISADGTDIAFVRADAVTDSYESAGWTRIHENVVIS